MKDRNITANVEPEDQRKIRVMAQFDGFNFSAFVRAKIRERYSEFMTRKFGAM